MTADEFCPYCGVTLDLHDGDDEERDCSSAELKAAFLIDFLRALR